MIPRWSRASSLLSIQARLGIERLVAPILVGAALLTGACDKVPLFAPTGSSITLTANTLVAPLNSDVQITAMVLESAGTAPQNGTTVYFSSNLGTFEPTSAQTTAGRVTVTFHAGSQSGTATILATSGAIKSPTGTDALKILIGAAAGKSIVVTASPTSVKSTGGSADIVASVLDESGNKLTGVPVLFSTDNGTLSATQVQTDAAGAARATLTTTKTAKVTATSGSLTKDVTIAVAAAPKGTVAASPTTINAGQTTSITVTPDAGNAGATSVALDFGDGSTQSLGAVVGAKSVSHTYSTAGTYNVIATFTDGNQDSSTAAATVTVGARVVNTVSVTVPNTAVAITELALITVTPTPVAGAAPTQSVRVEYGDGASDTLGLITAATQVTHSYTAAGTYTVRATLTDTAGQSSSGAALLTVNPPSITSTSSARTLTFTAKPTPSASIARYEWTFGDSSTQNTEGTNVVAHTYAGAGTYTVTVRIVGTNGNTLGTATLVVAVT